MSVFHGSLTRISDLEQVPYEVSPQPRPSWREGDYVMTEVVWAKGPLAEIELPSGRLAELVPGDRVVGALGRRHATLEVVGSWEQVDAEGGMQLLTRAGLCGKATSVSQLLPHLIDVRYLGHATRGGERLTMRGFVPEVEPVTWTVPTVLVVGTSMSAGKTASARQIIRLLVESGQRVVGCKLTGAGRYRDVLSMRDAGAHAILDFVDVGLPSSLGPHEQFRADLDRLLAMIMRERPDVVVAEAGASPLEPYNGDVVLDLLGEHVSCVVLCASDPYAVLGVSQAFKRPPDLVAGITANTTAGIELVDKLTGVKALNLIDPMSEPELRWLLAAKGLLPQR